MKTLRIPPTLRLAATNAFTLIELLVVIALIAVLAVLATGVIGPVRAAAHQAKCVGNLRASGQAMLKYFVDHDGYFFPSKYWYAYPSDGPKQKKGMRDYFGIYSSNLSTSDPEFNYDTVLTCPAMKSKYPDMYPTHLNRGYGVNYYLLQKNPSVPDDPTFGGARRMMNVPNLSAMWIITEAAVNGYPLTTTNEHTAEHAGDYLSMPHNGKQNVFYLDGHMATLTKQEFNHPPSRRAFWGNLNMPD